MDEVSIDPSGTAVVVWTEVETVGGGEWHGGIWASEYLTVNRRFTSLEQQLQDLKDALDSTNAIIAQLSLQVLELFIVFVTTIAALVILLSLSLRRGGFGIGELIRRRGARSEEPSASPRPSPPEAELVERQAVSQLSVTNSSPPLQASDGLLPVASIRLTAKERVLLHLLRYPRYADDLEVPTELTQEGIATAAWIDHRHFAQYAGPLVRDGLVRERTAHVRNGRQRRKVYDLTDIGKRVALRLVARAKSETVRVWDGEHIWDVRVGDILQKLNGKVSVLDIARHLTEAGVVDFAALGANWEDSSARAGESNPGSHAQI